MLLTFGDGGSILSCLTYILSYLSICNCLLIEQVTFVTVPSDLKIITCVDFVRDLNHIVCKSMPL